MITLLVFSHGAQELSLGVGSFLRHLDPDDQVLVAGSASGAQSDACSHGECGRGHDPRCGWVGDGDLLSRMQGEYLLPLWADMRLRDGALADTKAMVRQFGVPSSVRFPSPGGADPEDPFQGRRRRLFGVPMQLELTKPYLVHRDVLHRMQAADLVSMLREDDPAVLLELELAAEGGPGSGCWASGPLLVSDGGPTGELEAEASRRFLEPFLARSGREAVIQRVDNGFCVQAQRVRGIDIELSTRCNARCVFCPQKDLSVKQNMKDEVFERVLAMIREQPIGTIYFIGRGEPLMHPRFVDYVREIRNWTGITFEVFTNGLALTPAVVDRLNRLNNAELNIAINVSLHSLKEDTHRLLTGTDLRIISENLRYLHSSSRSIRVAYAFVKNKVNEGEMARLRHHLDLTGNRDWDISLVYNKGGYVESEALFDAEFYQRQLPAKERALMATGPCWYSYSGLYYFVNVHGQYTLCHDDFEEDTILGEVGRDSLDVIDRRVAELQGAGGAARCSRCNKRQRELHHGGYGEDVAQVKDRFVLSCGA